MRRGRKGFPAHVGRMEEMAMGKIRYLAAGDSSVSVEFGNEISPEINRQIRAFKIAV